MKMEAHPLADVFPDMTETELSDLVLDIATNGQREPVVTLDGKILDGRQRDKACRATGKPTASVEYKGEHGSPLRFVLAKNLFRRHLDPDRRAELLAAMADAIMEEDERRTALPKGKTSEHLAKIGRVPARTVEKAIKVHKHGTEELKRSRKEGTVSLTRAAEIAAKTPEEQVKEIEREAAKAQKKNRLADLQEFVAWAVKCLDKVQRRAAPHMKVVKIARAVKLLNQVSRLLNDDEPDGGELMAAA